jgi:predicted  nucleic acid-binding Zn-ribbon protein
MSPTGEVALICADCGADVSGGTGDPSAGGCPWCGGDLERYHREGEGSVILPADLARVALQELEHTIARTGGGTGWEVGQHEEKAMTPLALARQSIEQDVEGAFTPGAAKAYKSAVDTIREVGEMTGEETAPADPLTSDVFRARDKLIGQLDGQEGGQ